MVGMAAQSGGAPGALSGLRISVCALNGFDTALENPLKRLHSATRTNFPLTLSSSAFGLCNLSAAHAINRAVANSEVQN